jgi:hypothetical protein
MSDTKNPKIKSDKPEGSEIEIANVDNAPNIKIWTIVELTDLKGCKAVICDYGVGDNLIAIITEGLEKVTATVLKPYQCRVIGEAKKATIEQLTATL